MPRQKFTFDTTIKIGPFKFNLAESMYNCIYCGNPATLKMLVTKNPKFAHIFRREDMRWLTNHASFCSTNCIKGELLKKFFELKVQTTDLKLEQYLMEPDDNSNITIKQPVVLTSMETYATKPYRKERIVTFSSYGPTFAPYLVVHATKIETKWGGYLQSYWQPEGISLYTEGEFDQVYAPTCKPNRLVR